MCGICGIVNLDTHLPVAGENVRRMCAAMRHRGPDEDGFFHTQGAALGMRRLSIIDLSGGSQPMYNERETACVVFNGRSTTISS